MRYVIVAMLLLLWTVSPMAFAQPCPKNYVLVCKRGYYDHRVIECECVPCQSVGRCI